MRRFLLIPHVNVHNANAMSSPYTIGFPAMTAWLGAVHALQRKLNQSGWEDIVLNKVGVSCHHFNLQTYRGRNDFVYSIIGTANPLTKKGERSAFIEEARCHLEVSLLIEYQGYDPDQIEELSEAVTEILHAQMKIASGDILSIGKVEVLSVDEDEPKDLKKLMNKLMLGHVIVERRDLMVDEMKKGIDALDAVLNHLKVMHRAEQDANGKVTWTSKRLSAGWIVPIAVGFQGISDLGIAVNQRDEHTPHRFAESIVTLGEFVMPYRIKNLDDMLWQYHVDLENNLYLCQTGSQLN